MTTLRIACAAGAILLLAVTLQPRTATLAASQTITCNDYSAGYCTKSTHPGPQAAWLITFSNDTRLTNCLSPVDTDGFYGVAMDARARYAQEHQQPLPINDGQSDYLDGLCARVTVPVPSRAALADPRLRAFYGRVRGQISDEKAIVYDWAHIATLTRCPWSGPWCNESDLTPAQNATWTTLSGDLTTRATRVRAQAPGTRAAHAALLKRYGVIHISRP